MKTIKKQKNDYTTIWALLALGLAAILTIIFK